jgi:hypothetical protein
MVRQSKYCTDTYVLVSMNAAAVERARAEAERGAAANAAANAGGPPDAPPVVPPVVPAAALPPAAQVVIGNDDFAQIIAACQPQPHVAGAESESTHLVTLYTCALDICSLLAQNLEL